MTEFFAAAAHRYGRLDCLVNNAGGTPYRPLGRATPNGTRGSSN